MLGIGRAQLLVKGVKDIQVGAFQLQNPHGLIHFRLELLSTILRIFFACNLGPLFLTHLAWHDTLHMLGIQLKGSLAQIKFGLCITFTKENFRSVCTRGTCESRTLETARRATSDKFAGFQHLLVALLVKKALDTDRSVQTVLEVAMTLEDLFMLGRHVDSQHVLLAFVLFKGSRRLLHALKAVPQHAPQTHDAHDAQEEQDLEKNVVSIGSVFGHSVQLHFAKDHCKDFRKKVKFKFKFGMILQKFYSYSFLKMKVPI